MGILKILILIGLFLQGISFINLIDELFVVGFLLTIVCFFYIFIISL